MKNLNIEYWNRFYSSKNNDFKFLNYPSQFAIHVINNLPISYNNTLLDIGCGNGRDSFFFLENKYKVISIDNSRSAILKTKKLCGKFKNFSSHLIDITKNKENLISFKKINNKVLYARFFIHSISESELLTFVSNVSEIMNKDEIIFLEYRNNLDKNLNKIFQDHNRSYFTAKFITSVFKRKNFKQTYLESSKGFSKIGSEDPFITRQHFIKN